jgi:hypothetical protein
MLAYYNMGAALESLGRTAEVQTASQKARELGYTDRRRTARSGQLVTETAQTAPVIHAGDEWAFPLWGWEGRV